MNTAALNPLPLQIPPATHCVIGVDEEGQVFYYTGRGGAAWVSRNPADAYVGWYHSGATLKAARLNETTPLHGLIFVELPGSAL
jgi:hypothetical protein